MPKIAQASVLKYFTPTSNTCHYYCTENMFHRIHYALIFPYIEWVPSLDQPSVDADACTQSNPSIYYHIPQLLNADSHKRIALQSNTMVPGLAFG